MNNQKKIDKLLKKYDRIKSSERSSSRLFRRIIKNKLIVIGGSIVVLFLFIALFANIISPYDPAQMDAEAMFSGISKAHPLGADQFGRDLMTRIFYGSRISMKVALFATMIASFFGIILGGITGFYGGQIDNIIMRLLDALFAIPPILLAISIVAFLGPSENNAIIAIGIAYIPVFARMVRSSVIANKEEEYIDAARVIGQSNITILFNHIIPNSSSIIIVQASVIFAEAIIFESGLSFLGLGSQPPDASWGKLLADSKDFINTQPTSVFFPGLTIALAVLGFNLLGDGLRDLLDPKLGGTEV